MGYAYAMKTTTCNKCGATDLVWRKSVKGNWYLSDPQTIETNTHGQFVSIPFAHQCEEVAVVESIDPARLAFEIEHLQAIKAQFPNSWTTTDEYKLLNLLANQVA